MTTMLQCTKSACNWLGAPLFVALQHLRRTFVAEQNVVETPSSIAKAERSEAVRAAPVTTEAKSEAAPERVKAPAVSARKTPKAKRPAKAAAARRKKRVTAKPAVRVATKARAVRSAKAKIIRSARAGQQRLEQGVKTMTKQTNQAGFIAADQIKTAFGDVNARAKTAMEKGAKIVEEMADLTRGNVEAIVASSKVAAKGVESLSQDAAEYSRKSFEEASIALKSFAEVKSATDFFRLQGDYARSAFDAAIAESARVSEAMLKIAGEVSEPITSRYAVAAERVKTLAA